MLGVIGIFGIFYYLENEVLPEKFSKTTTSVDPYLYIVINLRNIIFVLNCVPFIQLLGLAALVFAGIPLLMVYSLLVYFRFRQMNLGPPSATASPLDGQHRP